MNHPNNWQGFLFMVGSALLFSIMGAFAHALGGRLHWSMLVFSNNFITFLLAAGFLGTFTFYPHEYKNPFIWLRCFIGGLGTLTAFYAFSHGSLSIAVAIMNTSPIWVAMIRRVFYRDSISPPMWLMISLGVLGVVLIEAPSLDRDFRPLLAANFSAVVNALVQIFLHELSGVDSRKVVFFFSGISSLISLSLIALIQPGLSVQPAGDPSVMGLLLLMGGLGYGGQIAMTRAFALGHPAIVSLATLWSVVFGLVFDVLFFERGLHLPTLAGIGLIVVSATVIKQRM